jgi:glycosyltransferase involved in cell wall biosynthesis
MRFLWELIPIKIRGSIGQFTRFILAKFQVIAYRKKLCSNPPVSNNYTIVGFFSASIGHGIASKILFEKLKSEGSEVRKIDISDIQQSPRDNGTEIIIEIPNADDNIIFVVHPDLLIYTLNRLDKNILVGRKIIGYWVYELDKAPKSWQIANGLVHEIWTPSEYSAKALEKSFECPIKIVPHQVKFLPKIERNAILRKNWRDKYGIGENDFVCFQSFSFASSLDRKNVIGAIEAFKIAFNDANDKCLIIRHSSSKSFPNSLLRLEAAAKKANINFRLIEANGDFNEIINAYSGADCYISLHRAEGYGLNLEECIECGLPVIATNYSGNLQFMNRKNSYLVDYTLINAFDIDNIYKVSGTKWAQPNLEQAANYLLELSKFSH